MGGTAATTHERVAADYAALFHAAPVPFLVLSPDLVIVDANRAYLAVTRRDRAELVGRHVFEAFPPNPDGPDDGQSSVRASIERARDTGQPDSLGLQKYDITDPETGGFVERYWSQVNIPVLGEDGQVAVILNKVEDVTDYVLGQQREQAARTRGEEWRRRVEVAEADLDTRAQELRTVVAAEAVASGRLATLAGVALQLAEAQTISDLTDVVIDRGLTALGADGGAVAVRTEGSDTLRLTITETLGEQTQADYAELPLDGPLPGSVAAATGRRVLLPDRAAALAWAEEMEPVLAATGSQAWAALPLEVGGRLLGSLTIGWREPQEFSARDVELLAAFAAQCGQALARIQVREAERAASAAVQRMSETLQRSLLTEAPQVDHLQIAVRYLPAAEQAQVGGDWYDAFLTSDGSTTLVIGDVAGHDRTAAAAMGQVRNVLRGVAYTLGQPPAAVLSGLDRAMAGLAVDTLATAVVAQVEQSPAAAERGLRELRWSNAGHPPPLLISADGSAEFLDEEPDLLLGLDPATTRADHAVVLRPGATVVLYTDGLVERRGAALEDGLERLRATAEALHDLPAERFCDALLGELGSEPEDDVALLVLRAHAEDRPRPPDAPPVDRVDGESLQ